MKFSAIVNRINKEFQRIQTNPIENVVAVSDPKNIFSVQFCIFGLKDCVFEGGYYHGVLNLSPEYPMKPPSIKIITPNGRFEENKPICTSFTNYHPETWQLTWNIEKMLLAMVSFMNDTEASTGVIRTSDYEKRRLAQKSLPWNLRNNKDFVKFFKPYSKQLGVSPDIFTDPSKIDELEMSLNLEAEQQQNLQKKPLLAKIEKFLFIFASAFLILSAYAYMKTS